MTRRNQARPGLLRGLCFYTMALLPNRLVAALEGVGLQLTYPADKDASEPTAQLPIKTAQRHRPLRATAQSRRGASPSL